MYFFFLPLVFFIVTLIGAYMTEAVLQEIFWTLLKDICIFRKKRIHNFCLVENADHQRLLLVRVVSGIRELASCGFKAKRSKEKEIISTYSLSEHTCCNQN